MTASTSTLRFPGPTYNDRSSIVRLLAFICSLYTLALQVAQMVPLPYQHFLLTGYTPLTPAMIVDGGEVHISSEDFHGTSLLRMLTVQKDAFLPQARSRACQAPPRLCRARHRFR